MAEREVTKTGKDDDNDITSLCFSGAAWSPRSRADAVKDIDNGHHKYYVQQPGTAKAYVHTFMHKTKGKCLRTDPDCDEANNLDNLRDC